MADGLDLVVHSLNGTVGGMVLGPTRMVKILDLFDALRLANSAEAVAPPHLGLRKKSFDIRWHTLRVTLWTGLVEGKR